MEEKTPPPQTYELTGVAVVDEIAFRYHQLQVTRAVEAAEDPLRVVVPERFKDRIRLSPRICGVIVPQEKPQPEA